MIVIVNIVNSYNNTDPEGDDVIAVFPDSATDTDLVMAIEDWIDLRVGQENYTSISSFLKDFNPKIAICKTTHGVDMFPSKGGIPRESSNATDMPLISLGDFS